MTIALAVFAAGGCGGGGHVCEGLVCDQTTLTLLSPANAWQAGIYTLSLTLEGGVTRCTLQVPDSPPTGGVVGDCGSGPAAPTLQLVPVMKCPPTVCNQGACGGMSCAPVPGQFELSLVFPSLVAQVGLSLSLDGANLVSTMVAPKLTTIDAGGGCGTCASAAAMVTTAKP